MERKLQFIETLMCFCWIWIWMEYWKNGIFLNKDLLPLDRMQQDMNIGGFDQNALGKMVNLFNPIILLKYLFLTIHCPGCP